MRAFFVPRFVDNHNFKNKKMRPVLADIRQESDLKPFRINNDLQGVFVVFTMNEEQNVFDAVRCAQELGVTVELNTPKADKTVMIDDVKLYDLQQYAASLGFKAILQAGKAVMYIPFSHKGNIKLYGEDTYMTVKFTLGNKSFIPMTIEAHQAPLTSKVFLSFTSKHLSKTSNRVLNVHNDYGIILTPDVREIRRRFSNGSSIDNSYEELIQQNIMKGRTVALSLNSNVPTGIQHLAETKLLLNLAESGNIRALDLKVDKDTTCVIASVNTYLSNSRN